MKARKITLTLKVEDNHQRSVAVVQELDVLDHRQTRQLVEFLQRTVAEAYERAVREHPSDEET